MPVCRECQGSGKVTVKTEIMERCPECDATKQLPDGSECLTCNKWGQVGSGKFEVEAKLCKNCWGSGNVTEGTLTTWFLARVVPATLLLLGGGGVLIWLSWRLGIVALTGLAIIIIFGAWGWLMYHFTRQMPDLGEISVTTWFLIRAIPTTLTALAVGSAFLWIIWVYLQNAAVTAIFMLAIFAIWGVLMFFFINRLPE